MTTILLPALVLLVSLLSVSMGQTEEKRFYSWEAGATPSKRGVYSWAGKRSAPSDE